MKPEIYVEFSLVFDNDFDVQEVTRITGITPTESKNRCKNRYSPLTNKPIEGFWTINSDTYVGFDAEKAINDITERIVPQITKFANICNEHKGEAVFCIVASFEKETKPAIYFERPFLDVVNALHATIQTDMYIE